MPNPTENFVQKEEPAEETDLLKKIDFRTLLLELRYRIPVLLLIFIVVLTAAGITSRFLRRNSMKNWTAMSKVFHQTRSDRVPTFYKQLDTKSVMELLSTSGTMQRAAQKLNMGNRTIPMIRRQVKISIDKNKPDIITLTADYKTPKMAADLANAVAEAGVEEYIELQNGTLKGMLTERKRRKTQLLNEVESLEAELSKYISSSSAFAPDEELNRVRTIIADRLLKLEDARAKEAELNVKVEELDKNLKTIDKEIRYMHKIHGGDDSELDRMRKDLAKMEQNYTEKNPRIIRMRSELAQREHLVRNKEQSPDEIIYSANQVYLSLQELLMKTKLEQKVVRQNRMDYQKQLDENRKYAATIVERMGSYKELTRRLESAKNSLKQLEVSINDLDFLLNSTIPDLSVLELAVPPMSANRSNLSLVSLFLAILATAGTAILFLLYAYAAGPVKSGKELQILLDRNTIGEIPSTEADEKKSGRIKRLLPGFIRQFFNMNMLFPVQKVSVQEEQAAILDSFNRLRGALGENGRKIFLYRFSDQDSCEAILTCWLEHFGVQGLKVFRLKCAPLAQKEEQTTLRRNRHSELDDQLICVEKYANRGFFYYHDDLFLAPAECDLLKEDLTLLEKHYDLVFIERIEPGNDPGQTFLQIATLSDYTVVLAEFNQTPKSLLRTLGSEIREYEEKFLQVGGILFGAKPPFWKG